MFNEGLFDIKYKKPLPKYPNKIGIITAPYGAAIQDMLRTIKQRWPIASVYIYPSLVQGNDAKFDIVKNIKLADNDNLDVIICGRGGGSIEDLWPFNEEMVAYAFYNCKTPIISAVGHEIDTTISDYVADARGLTPTDGAIKATPNLNDVLLKISDLKNQLNINFNNYIKFLKTNVSNLKESYVLTNPLKIYENYRFKVDDLENSLIVSITNLTNKEKLKLNVLNNKLITETSKIVNNNRSNLSTLIGKLDGLSPLKVLNRGYAFASIDNKVVKSIKDVNVNDVISLSFNDGKVISKIIDKEEN